MELIPYDSPINLFRKYQPEECDSDGYPLVWPKISNLIKRNANGTCRNCGLRPTTYAERLTTDHMNYDKADCRVENLQPLCWPCHLEVHSPRAKVLKCPVCREIMPTLVALRRHLSGIHDRKFEPEPPWQIQR